MSVDTSLPKGARELDALQRQGVLSLLRDGLDSIEAVEGPGGLSIEIVDDIVAVHPEGALLKLFVDAPALELAEDAIREVAGALLARSELLADWQVTKCEVELHAELAQESLDAAGGPDAPPADPRERARWHAEDGTAEAGPGRPEAEAMRARLRSLAPRLRAFSPVTFGHLKPGSGDAAERRVSRPDAELAAGALVHAGGLLVDDLFQDVTALVGSGTSATESDGVLMVLDKLPRRFAAEYTPHFAKRLAVTAVSLTTRMTRPGPVRLSCVAEQLLLRLLLAEARAVVDTHGLLDEGVRSAWAAFAAEVYEGADHDRLYRPVPPGAGQDPDPADGGVADWFTPFDPDRYVHPYAADARGGDARNAAT